MTDPVSLWLAALESGEYKQGAGQLKDKNGYCCLGVLCEVAKAEGVIQSYKPDSAVPPSEVVDWAKLNSGVGMYRSRGQCSLANDNDSLGRSFREIADTIRSRPEGLFHG